MPNDRTACVFRPPKPVVALVYDDGADVEPMLAELVVYARARATVAGFLQHDRARADRRKCDMYLEDLATGAMIAISEDRGADSHGCRLDNDAMARAEALCAAALADQPDLLVINKFGKTEGEGGGFRPLMAHALETGVPIVIAVPRRNLAPWRAFAGDLAQEYDIRALPSGAPACARALQLLVEDCDCESLS